ncbi:MAG: putative immunity protein [Bacteroidota bacterium]
MRDKQFVAEHRGGNLSLTEHRLLMKWAVDCVKHIFPLIEEDIDQRLNDALRVAKEWENGGVKVGDARKASLAAIAVANESNNQTIIYAARSVGHAVATAHMADHSIVAAEYALKVVKTVGLSVEDERKWQDEQIAAEIKDFVLSFRNRTV